MLDAQTPRKLKDPSAWDPSRQKSVDAPGFGKNEGQYQLPCLGLDNNTE